MKQVEFSFKAVINVTVIGLFISIVLAGIFYLFTKSFDEFLSILVYFIILCFAGCIMGLLYEYQIKRKNPRH